MEYEAERVFVSLCSRTIGYLRDERAASIDRRVLNFGGILQIFPDGDGVCKAVGPVHLQTYSNWSPSEALKMAMEERDLNDITPVGQLHYWSPEENVFSINLHLTEEKMAWLMDVTSGAEGEISDFSFLANVVIRDVENWGGPIEKGFYPIVGWEISRNTGKDAQEFWDTTHGWGA